MNGDGELIFFLGREEEFGCANGCLVIRALAIIAIGEYSLHVHVAQNICMMRKMYSLIEDGKQMFSSFHTN